MNRFSCPGEGRFADPDDCSSYFDCVSNPPKPVHKTCPFGGFEPVNGTCVSLPGCTRRESRDLVYDPSMNGFCTGNPTADVCANCFYRVVCIEGKAYKEGCEYQTESNPSYCRQDKSHFNGKAVCYPEDFDECDCTRGSGEVPDEFNADYYGPDEFFVCPTDGMSTIPKMYQCPTDETFDESENKCVKDSMLVECRESGSIPFYPNCNSYMKCISTASSFFRKIYTCELPNFYWNPETDQCEDPCNWNLATPFVCTSEGRYSDPFSCRKYHECVPDQLGGLEDRVEHCPEGTIWKGFCDPGDENDCALPTQTRCNLPTCPSITK